MITSKFYGTKVSSYLKSINLAPNLLENYKSNTSTVKP